MADPVIRVENLGKRYRLIHQAQVGMRYQALRDVLANRAKGAARRVWSAVRGQGIWGRGRRSVEDFWALREVSFDVERGEVLGIIGRNGAGKSTVLKLLSRITQPSEGRVTLRGRVGSLLEVGTGFHPELTGRENIFLNGALLGMSRAEIRGKFDEIVAFAEVAQFLDTPVKRYSSGMYVRLAFAVAAHLEPEILIVDEVLAVGDMEFQKKCLGKMESVARGEGRTILFVSHNMEAVARLCSRALLLKAGRVGMLGETKAVVATYLGGEQGTSFRFRAPSRRAPGVHEVARLHEIVVHAADGHAGPSYSVQEDVGVTMTYEVLREDVPLVDNFNVFNEQGVFLFVAHNVTHPNYNRPRPKAVYRSTAWIPKNLLPEGVFTVSAALVSVTPFQIHFHEEQAVSFRLVDPQDGTTARGRHVGQFPGLVRPLLRWHTESVPDAPTAGLPASSPSEIAALRR